MSFNARTIDPSWIYQYQEVLIERFLNVKIGSKNIKSPFREDKHPTCGFYYGKNERLYLHDFATGEHFDILDIGMKVLSKSKAETLKHVLGLLSSELVESKSEKVIINRDYVYEFIGGEDTPRYFDRYKINDATLNKYGVQFAKAIYIDGVLSSRSTTINPIYIYKVASRLKIYRPLSPERSKKWGGNLTMLDIAGWENLDWVGDICIITKSLKDVMVLRELGYNAISFQAETIGVGGESAKFVESTIIKLKKRYKHIIFFMDNDKAGRASAKALVQRNRCPFMELPERTTKDISDYIEKYGRRKSQLRLRKMISKLYRVNIETPY